MNSPALRDLGCGITKPQTHQLRGETMQCVEVPHQVGRGQVVDEVEDVAALVPVDQSTRIQQQRRLRLRLQERVVDAVVGLLREEGGGCCCCGSGLDGRGLI